MNRTRTGKEQRDHDAKEAAKRDARYWVRVMDRLHRLQSRALSRDPFVQELMKRYRA